MIRRSRLERGVLRFLLSGRRGVQGVRSPEMVQVEEVEVQVEEVQVVRVIFSGDAVRGEHTGGGAERCGGVSRERVCLRPGACFRAFIIVLPIGY